MREISQGIQDMVRQRRTEYSADLSNQNPEDFRKQLFIPEEKQVIIDGIVYPNVKHIMNGQELLGTVSKNYQVINTSSVLDEVENMLQTANIRYALNRVYTQGATQMVRIELLDFIIDVDERNTLKMFLLVENNYAGKKAYNLFLEILRLICTNGSTVASRAYQFTVRHKGNANQQVIDGISGYLMDSVDTTKLMIEKLGNTEAVKDKVMTYIDMNKIITSEYHKELMRENFIQEGGRTLWDLYNAFTYTISHYAGSSYNAKLVKRQALNKEIDRNWSNLTPAGVILT